MLPENKNVKLQVNVFPTDWQAVIFRNYGFVPTSNIAHLLDCSVEIVDKEATRLGLESISRTQKWLSKGYITIIRNNWFLLPYDQLCILLGITAARLDFILQNDDFLWVKLGYYKPDCKTISYKPLTEEQIVATEKISTDVQSYIDKYEVEPFEFFNENSKLYASNNTYEKGTRIVHGYLSPCGDVFMEDSEEYMSDVLLENYSALGVTGVWLHGVLSMLSPYPFDEALSKNYTLRRRNLRKLVDRCKKYGIKVYLYLNEPRGLPEHKIGKYANLIGHREEGYVALCFERQETRQYLYGAVKDLFSDIKELGGIITITMSENLTHCNYRTHTNCAVCKDVSPERTAAAVNNVIQQALKDSGSQAELIANLWGWSPYLGWSEEQIFRGVELLDKDISVICVSEYDLDIKKGGIKSKVIDYSVSNPGPSAITKKILKKAREIGHKTYAKIQINNSWECSGVPYLPVFDLFYKHLTNLSEIGVEDYMLTWTLGGYPSPVMALISEYAQSAKNFSLEAWYIKTYGQHSATVKEAVERFCCGFQEYPFSIDALYNSPKTLGCANLWSLESEEKLSTMVCYAFDDYENWIKPYPIEVYLNQYEKLLTEWEKGCVVLDNDEDDGGLRELKIFARAAYCHFRSDYLQTKFSYLKRDRTYNAGKIREILAEEKENALRLLKLVYKNACVGFEASNHYYYTDRNLIEKILLMDRLNQNL